MEKVHEASSFIVNSLSEEAKELQSNLNNQLQKLKNLGIDVKDVLGGEKGLGETQALAQHVAYLADRLKNKVLQDPVGTMKQLSPCKLVNHANQCRIYKPENLYDRDPGIVRMELKYLVGQRDISLEDLTSSAAGGFGSVPGGFLVGYLSRAVGMSAVVGLMIENRSQFYLHYHDSKSKEGHFFTDNPKEIFRGPYHTIEPGFTIGCVHTKDDLMPQSSAGYICFSVTVGAEKTHQVIMTWDVYRNSKNKIGLEIREEAENHQFSHVDFGKITVHEHDGSNQLNEIQKELAPYFRLRYLFSNEKITGEGFHLIVEDF